MSVTFLAICIIVGIIVLIIASYIVYKLVFKKEKINNFTLTAVGLTLTGIGIFIIANLNRILSIFGIKIPLDTDPINPENLKEIIAKEREKIRKEKEDALNKKTPDDIINNDLPDSARDGVLSTINNGKQRLDDLFHPRGVSNTSGQDETNNGRDNKTGSQESNSSSSG
jgi:hypothetical protein